MSNERFNELLNGPLAHPVFPMRLNRLVLALRHIVEATEHGAAILEAYCANREDQDRENEGFYDPENEGFYDPEDEGFYDFYDPEDDG
jgi:hypothetical protein